MTREEILAVIRGPGLLDKVADYLAADKNFPTDEMKKIMLATLSDQKDEADAASQNLDQQMKSISS